MSKKTFYVYFASKDELIEELLRSNVAHMEQKMRTTMDSPIKTFSKMLNMALVQNQFNTYHATILRVRS